MFSRLDAIVRDEGQLDVVRLLFNHVNDAICILDHDLSIILWNKTMTALSGRAEADIQGKRLMGLFPPLQGSEEEKFIRQTFQGHSKISMNSPYAALFGNQEKFPEVKYVPLYGHDRQVLFCMIVIKDVSSIMQFSERIVETENRFHTMADNAPVMLWMSERDGRCTFFNKQWFNFSGRSLDQEKDFGWAEGVHPEDFQYCIDTFMGALSRKKEFIMEYRLRRADGQYRWILDTGVPRFLSDKTFAGYIGSCIDITQRKESDQSRERMLSRELAARKESDDLVVELENRNRLKDEFLASLSHELRTPLNAVLGFSELIMEGDQNPDDLNMALDAIHRNAKIQVKLVNDLLDLSRIISGKLVLDKRLVQVGDVVTHAVRSVTPAALAKEIEIEVLHDENVGLVNGDPERLQQIFWNILTNAIRYTPQRGKVVVRVAQQDEKALVSFKDNGKGIDPAFLPHVFERFRQAEDTVIRRYKGLGIGLSIVKQLVDLHSGSVTVASEGEGKGALFSVLLPVANTYQMSSPAMPTPLGTRIFKF